MVQGHSQGARNIQSRPSSPPTGSARPSSMSMDFLVAQQVKNLPAKQDTGDLGSIPGSGRSLEEGMATHSRILAWRIPQTEEPGGLESMGSQRVRHTERLMDAHVHLCLHQYLHLPKCLNPFSLIELDKKKKKRVNEQRQRKHKAGDIHS